MRSFMKPNRQEAFSPQERVESLDSGDEFSLERWIRASDLLSESDTGIAGTARLCTAWKLQPRMPSSEVEPTAADEYFAGHIVR